jgi:hypothetical protein
MELQMKSHIKMIFQNPGCQCLGRHTTEDRREVNGVLLANIGIRESQYALGVLIVLPVCNNKFDLVTVCQPVQILQIAATRLTTGWTFEIDNLHAAVIDLTDVLAAVGFQQNLIALLKQTMDKGRGVFLDQGLTTCDFNETALVGGNPYDNLIYLQVFTLFVSVLGITI